MQINHITDLNFKNSSLTTRSGKKVRYKHFYEMADEDLKMYSMLKAYNSVQNSGKMHLKEALPALTSVAIGTSLALTQPGKLSAKAKTGLGFLALTTLLGGAYSLLSKGIDNYYKNQEAKGKESKVDKNIAKLGALVVSAGVIIGASALAGAKKGVFPESNKVVKFLEKEKTTLANELNNSKLGKFVEKTLNPFLNKHQKATAVAGYALPVGIIAGSAAANQSLSKSISKDMSRLSKENYIKGKSAQIDARAHFDKIDAIEV